MNFKNKIKANSSKYARMNSETASSNLISAVHFQKIQYAVIMDWPCINGEEHYSVALSSWIFQQSNKYFCYWPPKSSEVKKYIRFLKLPADDWHTIEIKVVAVYETYAEAIRKERRLVEYCLTSEDNESHYHQPRSLLHNKQQHVSPPPSLGELRNVSYKCYEDYRANLDTTSNETPILESSNSQQSRAQQLDNIPSENNDSFEIEVHNSNSNGLEHEQSNSINQELLTRISGQVAQLIIMVNSIDDRMRRLEHTMNVHPRLMLDEANIPRLPFRTIEEIKKFETEYSEEIHNAMVNRLCLTSGKDMRTCIFNQLTDLLAPEVGHLCSWAGRNNNFEIQNTGLSKIVLDATRKNFPSSKKNELECAIKDWLKAGNQRYKRAMLKTDQLL